jgi:hypothetical protein
MDQLIFESPDSGETIYVRKFGETARTLHSKSQAIIEQEQLNQDIEKYKLMRHMAKTNPTLNSLLEQCSVVYNLSKDSQ